MSGKHPSNKDLSLDIRPTNMGEAKPAINLPPPEDRGRLADHELIGRGGMGVIWKARDVGLDRWVAVKRVQTGLANYEAIVSRFLQEAKTLAKLKHPNIVHVHSLGHDEVGDFIEMEFIDGPSLLELLATQGTFSVEETIRIARKVCEGLHEVHRRDIIHRDIKPSNILIDSYGQPKLIDFGIAQAGSGSLHTLSGQALGTEGYMAPEQMEDAKNVTAACDQYGLGATMYQMLTGTSPRKIDFRKVPEVLLDIVSKALEDEPKNRFANIAEFHRALGVVKRGEPVKATLVAPPPQPVATKDLAARLQEARTNADRSHAEARQAFESFDDQAALTALQRVPENLRDRGLEEWAKKRLKRAAELEKEIEQRVQHFQTDGLRGLVDELLRLYPRRTDMVALREQLPKEAPKLLVAPFDVATAKQNQSAWSEHLGRPVDWTNSIGMKFRLIPPGEFLMGAANGEEGASEDEKPQHKVRITKPLYLGIYPVTQEEYQKVTGANPSHFKGESSLPVESVSWDDAQAFLKSLSGKDGGHKYRLPTEAEWEYACRAGTTTPFWFGNEL